MQAGMQKRVRWTVTWRVAGRFRWEIFGVFLRRILMMLRGSQSQRACMFTIIFNNRRKEVVWNR
jgi:hypothetical protein